MWVDDPQPIVRWPTGEEAKAAFEAYALGVGKVSHAWNYLQEVLGSIFVQVLDTKDRVAFSVWYSTPNDRAQRDMLKAAVLAFPEVEWPRFPNAKADLLCLVERANALADLRNNAIHMPGALNVDANGPAIGPSIAGYLNGHPRAKKLIGKKLLLEFDSCERNADALSLFGKNIISAFLDNKYAWPDRPLLPNREPKKTPGQPRPRTKSRQRQRRSSQA